MRRSRLFASACVLVALVLPASALATPVKKPGPDGRVPPVWNMEKPAPVPHKDTIPPSASGDGDGRNSLPFTNFDHGDLIVVLGTAAGHSGQWDDSRYTGSLYSYCVWSANTSPKNGVQLEQPIKYRNYDQAYGLWVPSVSATKRVAARSYSRGQNGEPYLITSSKSDQSKWYCSKLGWASYRYTSNVDLDADGGYWVWPVDLVNDSQTSLFAKSD